MMHLSEEKKIIENYGFKWMVLVLFESELYIASVMFIEKKKKLCMTCLAVIMMSICEMCMKLKNKEKKGKRIKYKYKIRRCTYCICG